jgi:hypothetical protein
VDAAESWFDLAGATIRQRVPDAWKVELRTGSLDTPACPEHQ